MWLNNLKNLLAGPIRLGEAHTPVVLSAQSLSESPKNPARRMFLVPNILIILIPYFCYLVQGKV